MPIIRDIFQKIVNAAHIRWDPEWSPPILKYKRISSTSHQEISQTQLSPYELYQESVYLSNPIYFKELQRFVLALWQDKLTTNTLLAAELLEQQESKLIKRAEIIEHLTWCVQQSPPRFQLCWPSVS